jgi:exosortase
MFKKYLNVIKLALIFALFIIIYLPSFKWMLERFDAPDSYYSHGYLVPFVSIALIYLKRNRLKNIKKESSVFGLVLIILSLLLYVISLILDIGFAGGISFLITLIGLSLYLGGKDFTKEIWFPLFFLIFMIPLPRILVIHISFKMKLLAAEAGTFLINKLGIVAFCDGSIIYLPNTALTVGSPCSGLRSLIALLGLGTLYAYMADLSSGKKYLLFLSSIPFAFLGNILRITLLLWVAYKYGSEVATGRFHDYSGYAIFVFTLLGLIGVNKLLQWKKEK